jgi:hypothetical protein
MAYFAKLENNIVVDVIVVNNEDCAGGVFPESEAVGQTFIASLNLDGKWLQTSDDFRKQYAYAGCTYDVNADVFIAPQPFASWSLDANNDWQAPEQKPEGDFYWDESSLSWLPIPDAG